LELLKQAQASGQPFAVAFIDVRMPVGWDGIETTRRVWQEDDDLQTVLCTAYSDYSLDEIRNHLPSSERLLILKKPFDNIEVVQMANSLAEKWALRQAAKKHVLELEEQVRLRTKELESANAQLKEEMAQRVLIEETLRQSQKMEALGRLAGGVAHDFNNLLTVIRGYAQCLISDGDKTDDVLDALKEIDAAAERAANLTAQMLMFSRKKRLKAEYLNLNEVVMQLGKMLRRLLNEDVSLHIDCSANSVGIDADRAMIEQIILNLVVNSRDAMPQGGHLVIKTEQVMLDHAAAGRSAKARPGCFALISVSDSGLGIAKEVLPHLFEPFYTTKEPGKGTGLGLATIHGIVKQHDGWIDVHSMDGQGALFKVFLPIAIESKASQVSSLSVAPGLRGSETILLVEDEEPVRILARGILRNQGYTVHEASSGADALKAWDHIGTEIDLVLTDMVMPDGISGLKLGKTLSQRRPGLKVVYTTGHCLDVLNADHGLVEGLNFLSKPYYPQKLLETIRSCLGNQSRMAAAAFS
jgi:signal transduction histidine kinase/ActR/RegA family two-component response regulator